MKYIVHNQIESLQFLTDYQPVFTTRSDGSSWPNWQKTWLHATRYFRGLIRPGTNKSVAGIASMINIKQRSWSGLFANSAADIAKLYQARWEVELLFRELKTVYGLDEINSGKPELWKR